MFCQLPGSPTACSLCRDDQGFSRLGTVAPEPPKGKPQCPLTEADYAWTEFSVVTTNIHHLLTPTRLGFAYSFANPRSDGD